MQRSSTNCAITNKQSLTGPPHNRLNVVAKTGEPSKQRPTLGLGRLSPSILSLGGARGHCGRIPVEQSVSLQKRISQPASTRPSVLDQAQWSTFHAKFPRFRTCAKNSGQSIQNRSRAILPNPPSTNSKKPLKVPSSIAKTNNHHPCASTARASTTNPSNKHSKILPFSNQCPMTQLPLCHHLSRPSKNVTENPITGQLATDDNFRRVTSWQNGKKTFEAADPSFPLWIPRSVPCLTSS